MSPYNNKKAIALTFTTGKTLSKPTESKLKKEVPLLALQKIKKNISFGSESLIDIRPLPKSITANKPLQKNKKDKAA